MPTSPRHARRSTPKRSSSVFAGLLALLLGVVAAFLTAVGFSVPTPAPAAADWVEVQAQVRSVSPSRHAVISVLGPFDVTVAFEAGPRLLSADLVRLTPPPVGSAQRVLVDPLNPTAVADPSGWTAVVSVRVAAVIFLASALLAALIPLRRSRRRAGPAPSNSGEILSPPLPVDLERPSHGESAYGASALPEASPVYSARPDAEPA